MYGLHVVVQVEPRWATRILARALASTGVALRTGVAFTWVSAKADVIGMIGMATPATMASGRVILRMLIFSIGKIASVGCYTADCNPGNEDFLDKRHGKFVAPFIPRPCSHRARRKQSCR